MLEFPTETGRIAYQIVEAQDARTGAPSTLTLLHNFMSTGMAAWGRLLPELSRCCRILLPDLPGHGRSVGHPAQYNHRAIVRQLAALMQHEGFAASHLAGASSGGMLAQLLVHDRLVAPATLTLVSTTYSINPAMTGSHAELLPEHFQAAGRWLEATARLHDPYHYPGYFDTELLPGFRRLTGETAIDLPLAALRRFVMPLCIIHGSQDEFFPPAIPQQMAATAPDTELHIVPQQTHALLFRQPWQVAKIMLEFLIKQCR